MYFAYQTLISTLFILLISSFTNALPTTPPSSSSSLETRTPSTDQEPDFSLLEIESRDPDLDPNRLADRGDNFSASRNELGGTCKAVTVIFARGTIEIGNVGLVAGPPFFNALARTIGDNNLAVQGVNYAASILGYLRGGDAAGSNMLASLAQQAATRCPNTQIVLSGYSQGAQLVHLATRQLSAQTAQRISAVVLFGDPDKDDLLANVASSNVVTYCFDDDLVCKGAPIVLPAHLAYGLNAGEAADFVRRHVQI